MIAVGFNCLPGLSSPEKFGRLDRSWRQGDYEKVIQKFYSEGTDFLLFSEEGGMRGFYSSSEVLCHPQMKGQREGMREWQFSPVLADLQP